MGGGLGGGGLAACEDIDALLLTSSSPSYFWPFEPKKLAVEGVYWCAFNVFPPEPSLDDVRENRGLFRSDLGDDIIGLFVFRELDLNTNC